MGNWQNSSWQTNASNLKFARTSFFLYAASLAVRCDKKGFWQNFASLFYPAVVFRAGHCNRFAHAAQRSTNLVSYWKKYTLCDFETNSTLLSYIRYLEDFFCRETNVSLSSLVKFLSQRISFYFFNSSINLWCMD